MMDSYTVQDLVLQLSQGVLSLLPWVAVGVSAAVILAMVFLGIRSGIRFFRLVAWERYKETSTNLEDWDASHGGGSFYSDNAAGFAAAYENSEASGYYEDEGYDMDLK